VAVDRVPGGTGREVSSAAGGAGWGEGRRTPARKGRLRSREACPPRRFYGRPQPGAAELVAGISRR
jgi:hypothetical protein